MSDTCQQLSTQDFICKKVNLQQYEKNKPCEIQLLEAETTSMCEKITIKVAKTLVKPLSDSDKWIGILVRDETVKLYCLAQEEIKRLTAGTYLIEVPPKCQISIGEETICNNQETTKAQQPLLFSELDTADTRMPPVNISLHLDKVELDDLQSIKSQVIETQADIGFNKVFYVPSFWSLLMYGLLALAVSYAGYKKYLKRSKQPKKRNQQERVDLSSVELPR